MASALPEPVLVSTFLGLDEITIGGQIFEFKHVFFSWSAIAVLVIISIFLRARLTEKTPGMLQNVLETIVDAIEKFVVSNLGKDGHFYTPLLGGIFMYIFTMNFLGLVPGFDAPTANLNSTVCMALFVFVLYHIVGIYRWRAHYINQFTGPYMVLIPLMLPLEVVSHLARPVSLSLRLFGNIRGEEIVMILFFGMAPILSTIPIYALFLLGKTMQAFVFFMLTMFYLKGAIDGPEH